MKRDGSGVFTAIFNNQQHWAHFCSVVVIGMLENPREALPAAIWEFHETSGQRPYFDSLLIYYYVAAAAAQSVCVCVQVREAIPFAIHVVAWLCVYVRSHKHKRMSFYLTLLVKFNFNSASMPLEHHISSCASSCHWFAFYYHLAALFLYHFVATNSHPICL